MRRFLTSVRNDDPGSDDPGALVSGGYFYHRAPRDVLPAVRSGSS